MSFYTYPEDDFLIQLQKGEVVVGFREGIIWINNLLYDGEVLVLCIVGCARVVVLSKSYHVWIAEEKGAGIRRIASPTNSFDGRSAELIWYGVISSTVFDFVGCEWNDMM